MNILLTNDDGYNATGIKLLKKELEKIGKVYMVAPKKAMSGKSTSITIGDAKEFKKIDKYNYIVNGTPADCVFFAAKNIKEKFDVVVSGCNEGLNISVLTLYSGTIGACNAALVNRVPAVAFSAVKENFDKLKIYVPKIMNLILKNKLLREDIILNVNFPYTKEIKGIRPGKLSFNNGNLYFNEKDGKLYVDNKFNIDFKDKDGDLYLASNGYVSIVPLNICPFHIEEFKNLRKKIKGEI